MLSLITPENIDKILIGLGALVTAIGGLTLRRVMKEPPKPGTPDAGTVALAENTRAMLAMVEALKDQNANFADNNEMFRAIGHQVAGVARDIADIRHATASSEGHLGAIRDASNRRA